MAGCRDGCRDYIRLSYWVKLCVLGFASSCSLKFTLSSGIYLQRISGIRLGSPWRRPWIIARKNLISLLAKRQTPNPNYITIYQESVLNRTVYVCSPSDIYSAFNIVARHAMPHTAGANTQDTRERSTKALLFRNLWEHSVRVFFVFTGLGWLCLVCVSYELLEALGPRYNAWFVRFNYYIDINNGYARIIYGSRKSDQQVNEMNRMLSCNLTT